jgi:hypothetical protein
MYLSPLVSVDSMTCCATYENLRLDEFISTAFYGCILPFENLDKPVMHCNLFVIAALSAGTIHMER